MAPFSRGWHAGVVSAPEPTELTVTCVQAASGLEPDDNRARLDGLVGSAEGRLVVLPEAFARDFGKPGSDVGPFAEPADGEFATEVARVAAAHGRTVVAGMFETGPSPERPYNTLVLRGAAEASYRKIHLYDSFGYRESDRLTGGAVEPVVVDVDGWRLGLMTCYDLRFPELARRLVDEGAEVLVVPAAWVAGERKLDHWRTLLRPRHREHDVRRRRGAACAALHRALHGRRPAGRRARRGGGRRGVGHRDAAARGPRRRPSHEPVPGEPPTLRSAPTGSLADVSTSSTGRRIAVPPPRPKRARVVPAVAALVLLAGCVLLGLAASQLARSGSTASARWPW